ncbi:MAG: zinc ribbon domain-containing protein [Solirubrobacterales bacterium]
MKTRTEIENVKTSGSEKVLAAILTLFILIGGIWAYGQIGKISEDQYSSDYGGSPAWVVKDDLSQEDRDALKTQSQARNAVWKTERAIRNRTKAVEFTRETYRTEIDAGRPGAAELAAYREAQAKLASAIAANKAAKDAVSAARPAAAVANQHQQALREEKEKKRDSDDRIVFGLRLLLVAAMLGGGYMGLSAVRRRRSKLLPIALAEISAAALLAAYMAIEYGSDLIVFREIGPLVISLVGIVLTVLAFIALQRYLAKKIPLRRVRKRECPFCGYPHHGNTNCEGCGRRVTGECATCHEPRRVGTPHCGNCGAT